MGAIGLKGTFTWNVGNVAERMKLAAGRATVRVADEAAHAMKAAVRVDTTTLQLSIHSAPEDYDGSGDFVHPINGVPQIADLQEDESISVTGEDHFSVLAGSWVPYADKIDQMDGYVEDGANEAIPNWAGYLTEEIK